VAARAVAPWVSHDFRLQCRSVCAAT
jgi:hypothetical protein